MKHPEGRLIVTTASLCYCSSRAAIDICTQWAWLCYNKTLFTQVESQVQRWAIVCWPLVYCTSLIGPDAFVSVDPFLKRLSASLFKKEKMASFLQCPKKAAEKTTTKWEQQGPGVFILQQMLRNADSTLFPLPLNGRLGVFN